MARGTKWKVRAELGCGLLCVGAVFMATGCDRIEGLVAVARTAAGESLSETIGDAIGGVVDTTIGGTLGGLLGNSDGGG